MYKTNKREGFSKAYIRAIASPLGFNYGEFSVDDDSIDVVFTARYPITSKKRKPQINIQLKCTKLKFSKDNYLHFSLPIKNYEDLRGYNQANPCYLVVLCVPENEDAWVELKEAELILRYSAYWYSLKDCPEKMNEKRITVLIPKTQRLDKLSFKMLMDKASDGIML